MLSRIVLLFFLIHSMHLWESRGKRHWYVERTKRDREREGDQTRRSYKGCFGDRVVGGVMCLIRRTLVWGHTRCKCFQAITYSYIDIISTLALNKICIFWALISIEGRNWWDSYSNCFTTKLIFHICFSAWNKYTTLRTQNILVNIYSYNRTGCPSELDHIVFQKGCVFLIVFRILIKLFSFCLIFNFVQYSWHLTM